MKSKYLLRSLFYLLLIITICIMGRGLLHVYNNYLQLAYDNNSLYLAFINFIFFGGIGIALGLDNFICSTKKKGKWKFNISKLLILGIPSLICSISYVPFIFNLFNGTFPKAFSENNIIIISNVALGHTLISSFYKY